MGVVLMPLTMPHSYRSGLLALVVGGRVIFVIMTCLTNKSWKAPLQNSTCGVQGRWAKTSNSAMKQQRVADKVKNQPVERTWTLTTNMQLPLHCLCKWATY